MKTKWFLIPKETVDLVVKTFQKCSEMIEFYAQGKITQLDPDVMYSKFIKNNLHEFETSLHITEVSRQ